jgi:hypothetical protein
VEHDPWWFSDSDSPVVREGAGDDCGGYRRRPCFCPVNAEPRQDHGIPPPPDADRQPVLDSLRPVIEGSRQVKTDVTKVVDVARWMAYEELPFPQFTLPFGLEKNRNEAIDFTLVSNSINSAFSDFNTSATVRKPCCTGRR